MKKTLITLAALAMASVATADSLQYNSPENPTGAPVVTYGANNAYTLLIIVDWDKLAAYDSAWPGSEVAKTTDYWSQTHAMNMWRDNESTVYTSIYIDGSQVTGQMESGTGATVGSDKNNYILDKNTYGLDMNGKTMLGLALTFTDINKLDVTNEAGEVTGNKYTGTVNLYAVKADGTYGHAYVTDSDLTANFNRITFDATQGVVNKAMFFDYALSGEQIAATTLAYIPEPTTTTLSLLALAGLAARRRRK